MNLGRIAIVVAIATGTVIIATATTTTDRLHVATLAVTAVTIAVSMAMTSVGRVAVMLWEMDTIRYALPVVLLAMAVTFAVKVDVLP